MKEAYTTPTMEVVAFSSEDIITTSSNIVVGDIGQDENELPVIFNN